MTRSHGTVVRGTRAGPCRSELTAGGVGLRVVAGLRGARASPPSPVHTRPPAPGGGGEAWVQVMDHGVPTNDPPGMVRISASPAGTSLLQALGSERAINETASELARRPKSRVALRDQTPCGGCSRSPRPPPRQLPAEGERFDSDGAGASSLSAPLRAATTEPVSLAWRLGSGPLERHRDYRESLDPVPPARGASLLEHPGHDGSPIPRELHRAFMTGRSAVS
jgi:hypothetical protein